MNEPALEPESSLGDQTVARVQEGLARGETAHVTQILVILQELSGQTDRLSVQELAVVIGRDVAMVAKIMGAANCLGYNPGGVDVTTLHEAISVIGFEKIRNLTISLLLLESAENLTERKESHDVAALALCSALMSQVITAERTSINPEQAFVCGALRHYGRLLLSSFMPEEYDEALDLAEEMSLDPACCTVFGLTALELSRRIFEETRMPQTILKSLKEVDEHVLQGERLSETNRLQAISGFSSDVCELLGSPRLPRKAFDEGRGHLLKTYSQSVGLTEKDLSSTLLTVDRLLSTFGRSQGVQNFSSPVLRRIRSLGRGAAIETVVARGRVRAGSSELTEHGSAHAVDAIAVAIDEVRQLVNRPQVDPRQVFGLAARALKSGLGLRNSLVFLKEPTGPLYAAMVGSGALFTSIRNQPLLNPENRDVFTVCLARGEDVLIQNSDAPNIAPFIPEWFRQAIKPCPFVLLPVKDPAGTFAILCGTGVKGEPLELSNNRLQQLKTLRSELASLRSPADPERKAP